MKASDLTGEEPVIDHDDKSLTAIEGGGLRDVLTTMYNQARPANTTGICTEAHKPGQAGPIICRAGNAEG